MREALIITRFHNKHCLRSEPTRTAVLTSVWLNRVQVGKDVGLHSLLEFGGSVMGGSRSTEIPGNAYREALRP